MNTTKRKINFVDVLIFSSTLLIAVLLLYFFFSDSALVDFSPKDKVEITVFVDKISSEHSGLIKQGDTAWFSESSSELGKVSSVGYSSSSDVHFNSISGIYERYYYPDLQEATVTIECEAEIDDDVIFINNEKIEIGKQIEFHVPEYNAVGTIVTVSVRSLSNEVAK